jgi:hypothetical protein
MALSPYGRFGFVIFA